MEGWLASKLAGARFSLEPASEDASFRRYFRARLEDGRSYVVMDAPPGKEEKDSTLRKRLEDICNQTAEQIRKHLAKIRISDLAAKE